MWKKILAMAAAMAAVALLSSVATAGGLAVGDVAPKLSVKKFVKGTPVTQFEKGNIYVVEFWATWCGPCRESIPHLTEMAKKNKDVTFVGVSVWETNQKDVAPFVAKMGGKMNYHVAMDTAPGDKGAMAMGWMQPAGIDAIPAAFIINKESKVAWIGHPMEMEEPLAKIVAGTWDIKAMAEKSHREALAAAKLRDLQAKILPAYKAKEYAKVVSMLDEAIAKDPEIESTVAPLKLTMLREQGKTDDEAAYITKLTEGALKDNRDMLMQIAWSRVDPDAIKATPAVVAAALKAALRSDELSQGKSLGVAYTLAAAYFVNGDKEKAIQTQERAIQLAKGTPNEKNPLFAQTLEKYKAMK